MTNRIIAGIQTLLTRPEAWIKHSMTGRRDASGTDVTPDVPDDRANCWCLLGARAHVRDALVTDNEVTMDERAAAGQSIKTAIKEIFPGRTSDGYGIGVIPQFNDHRDTTHQDVLRVLVRAQEIAAS